MQPEACRVLGERCYSFSFPLVQIKLNIFSAQYTDIHHHTDSFPDLLRMPGLWSNQWRFMDIDLLTNKLHANCA